MKRIVIEKKCHKYSINYSCNTKFWNTYKMINSWIYAAPAITQISINLNFNFYLLHLDALKYGSNW